MIINGEYYDDEEPFGKSVLTLEIHKKFMKLIDIGRMQNEKIICICKGKPLAGMSEVGINNLDKFVIFNKSQIGKNK